jgi:hypothetical protein
VYLQKGSILRVITLSPCYHKLCLNSEDFLMLSHTSAHTQYVYSSHYLCYHLGGVAVTALIFYVAACLACETLVPLGLI